MRLFVKILSLCFFTNLIKGERSGQMKLEKTKEGSLVSKVGANGRPILDHEDSSSTTNNVIIKISENKKKKSDKKKSQRDFKNKKEKPTEKKPINTPPSTVPDSIYQVPTSNILFKDLEPKKISISEKDYQELLENNKMMSKSMAEFHKYFNKSNGLISKIKGQNSPKEDTTKPRDLFNIKVIEVSDDVKPTK